MLFTPLLYIFPTALRSPKAPLRPRALACLVSCDSELAYLLRSLIKLSPPPPRQKLLPLLAKPRGWLDRASRRGLESRFLCNPIPLVLAPLEFGMELFEGNGESGAPRRLRQWSAGLGLGPYLSPSTPGGTRRPERPWS